MIGMQAIPHVDCNAGGNYDTAALFLVEWIGQQTHGMTCGEAMETA